MIAIPAHRLLLVALAGAALALAGLGCGGDDDDSDGDSAAETNIQLDATTADATGEPEESDASAESAEGEDVFLSYRIAGAEQNPGQLGLEIDDDGRGTYAIGQGREIEFELSADELAGLRRTFERIGFSNLPERIEPKSGEEVPGVSEIEVGHDGHVIHEVPGRANSPLAPIHTAVAEIIADHAIESGTLTPAKPTAPPGE